MTKTTKTNVVNKRFYRWMKIIDKNNDSYRYVTTVINDFVVNCNVITPHIKKTVISKILQYISRYFKNILFLFKKKKIADVALIGYVFSDRLGRNRCRYFYPR